MHLELPGLVILASGLSGVGVYAAAAALGFRHGIDWDHIAAITDITSTTAGVGDEEESWLIGEPGVMLTDESHHATHGPHDDPNHAHDDADNEPHSHGQHAGAATAEGTATATIAMAVADPKAPAPRLDRHSRALFYGSLYALGHGSVVVVLGLLAIVAREFLPDWIDPVMDAWSASR